MPNSLNHAAPTGRSPAPFLLPFFSLVLTLALTAHLLGHFERNDLARTPAAMAPHVTAQAAAG